MKPRRSNRATKQALLNVERPGFLVLRLLAVVALAPGAAGHSQLRSSRRHAQASTAAPSSLATAVWDTLLQQPGAEASEPNGAPAIDGGQKASSASGTPEEKRRRHMDDILDKDKVARVVRGLDRKAWDDMGIKVNHEDDWYAYRDAIISNALMTFGCFCMFSFFRQRYRLVYQKNALDNWRLSPEEERSKIHDGVKEIEEDEHDHWPHMGECGGPLPARPRGYFFDWIAASFVLRTPEIITSAGLDQAMLVQFANMGMMTFASIGIPMLLIVAPMHIFLGGNAAGNDYLSWQGFANVEKGSFLCWVHAIIVWMVVLLVDTQIYYCQEQFVRLRINWLKAMPHIEACTLLVEGVPLRCRTNRLLTEFFNKMFGGRDVVESSNVLVRTERLEFEIGARDAAKKAYDDAKRQEQAQVEKIEVLSEQATARRSADGNESLHGQLSARFMEIVDESRQATSAALNDAMHATVKAFKEIHDVAENEVLAERHRLKRQIRKVERWSQEDIMGPPGGGNDDDSTCGDENTQQAREAAAGVVQFRWRERLARRLGLSSASARSASRSPTNSPRSQLSPRSESDGALETRAKPRTLASAFHSQIGLKDMKYFKALTKKSFLTREQQELDNLYSATAFVTFRTRYDAIMALRLVPYTPDREEFILSVAPEPSDVHFDDMKKPAMNAKAWTILGYILIGGMFFSFLPTIGFISAFANVHNLAPYDESGTIAAFIQDWPKVVRVWNGIAGAMGLNLVLSFLPTVLALISQLCFQKRAHAWSQHQLQKFYFFFLIVFQLLVVSMANSLFNAVMDTISDPLSLVDRLSKGMAQTTHFFLNIYASQWTVIGMEHTRAIQLIKYHLWKKMTSTPHEAIAGAEPEDQDYYGMGARSARYTSLFVIGLAFASLCPLICFMAFVTFAIMRVVVGYQVVYAETKKPDLGGDFWVLSLVHLQLGLLIYISCMTVMLLRKAGTHHPALLAGTAFFYVLESILTFQGRFHWKSVCHTELVKLVQCEKAGTLVVQHRKAMRDTYAQPELEYLKEAA
mmetsp:Transcript_132332/g.329973  ORF Transcript_132332/g.329973 Transcript_132332/m.329973 type:complete len:1032 (-) Transcript_132332:273-3368(-)